MGIGPVELNGAMTRLQDFTSQKHNQDIKGIVDQSNYQTQFNKEIGNKLNQVHKSDDPDNGEMKFDAKEKGHGSYEGDGGKGRNKEEKKQDGKVTPKTYGNFDIKI